MIKFLKRLLHSEKGQAMPLVLAVLAVGGLTVAASLNYTATSLNRGEITSEAVSGVYAASAGIEYNLWALGNSVPMATQLLENINQTAVSMQNEDKGAYTLYLGELIEPGAHSEYLDISGDIAWDEVAQAYKYTITVTLQHDSTIHLEEIGVKLPTGYSYQLNSAAAFVENLSTEEPDTVGAYLLNWGLGLPYPSVSVAEPVQTQIFYIEGVGVPEDYYVWVVANREDIGAVDEIAGNYYRITSTAQDPVTGKNTATIMVDVLMESGTAHIASWRILN
ncbi:hypothetical protein ACFLW5_02300 [Chloroflexota bacterium]